MQHKETLQPVPRCVEMYVPYTTVCLKTAQQNKTCSNLRLGLMMALRPYCTLIQMHCWQHLSTQIINRKYDITAMSENMDALQVRDII